MSDKHEPLSWQCPLPLQQYEHVLMAHGGGGRLMQQLFAHMLQPLLHNQWMAQPHDGAILPVTGEQVVMTTDSYVIRPLFFPGGDIGKLAVCGTVNDLAMCGAKPQYLSLSLILEEGLAIQTLGQILTSIRDAAQEADVQIVTGDTKVIEGRDSPGLLINTTGVGSLPKGRMVHPQSIKPGDAILLSGDIGRHGIAVMAHREGLEFETQIESDVAALAGCVERLFEAGVTVHCLRDLTRGGMATALYELAHASQLTFALKQAAIPVAPQVNAACELLGLDPLYVANEGRFVAIVPAQDAAKALDAMHQHPLTSEARQIGQVEPGTRQPLLLHNAFGTKRALGLLSGEQLPRIC